MHKIDDPIQVLVVDDELNIREGSQRILSRTGFDVLTAANGLEALDCLKEKSIPIILLDLKMPGMDGMEVLRRIKKDWPKIRVIIITAHGTIESAVEAMKLGAVDFIQKPFSPGDIRELAKSVLERETLDKERTVDYRALIELAKRYITDRSFADARKTVRKAIAADPGQPEAYNLLGALLEMDGNMFEAQKFYLAAMDIDPKFKPARANLKRTTSWKKSDNIDLGSDET